MGVFRGLIEDGQIGRVTHAFMEAIAASMLADKAPQTQAEIKRRFELCAGIFRELRGDLKWSITRAVDALPEYLRCKLDGHPYKPEQARAVWMPNDPA